jgi:hypothetical protein
VRISINMRRLLHEMRFDFRPSVGLRPEFADSALSRIESTVLASMDEWAGPYLRRHATPLVMAEVQASLRTFIDDRRRLGVHPFDTLEVRRHG